MGIGGKKKFFSSPRAKPQRHHKPSGYTEACRGVARQGEDGRTHLAQTSQTGLTGLTGLTQAPRSRAPQTAVAIKQAYPTGISAAAPNQTATRKPSGYPWAHPSSFYKSYKSYKSYASATPPQHAYRRSHQAALHTPAVNLHSEPTLTAAPQTLGVYRGLPRRSPSGRRRAHPSCQTGLTGLTQAPRRRDTHTTAAIKLPCIPLR